MTVVSNTTPLIGLAVIRRFDLLRQFFGEIVIPQAVYAEAVVSGREIGGAKQEIEQSGWIILAALRLCFKSWTFVTDSLVIFRAE